jgi:hypothetical protein
MRAQDRNAREAPEGDHAVLRGDGLDGPAGQRHAGRGLGGGEPAAHRGLDVAAAPGRGQLLDAEGRAPVLAAAGDALQHALADQAVDGCRRTTSRVVESASVIILSQMVSMVADRVW